MQTFEMTQAEFLETDPKSLVTGKYIIHRENGTKNVCTINMEPSLTDQSQAEDTDVNKLMERFNYNQLPDFTPVYADATQLPDLMAAGNAIAEANVAFEALPAKTRYRFQNSPQEMINFMADPENYDEAVKLGLLQKAPSTTVHSGEETSALARVSPQTPNKKGPGTKAPKNSAETQNDDSNDE